MSEETAAEATPAPETAPAPAFDMDAFLTTGWKEKVPEEFRTAGVVAKAGRFEDLIKSAASAEKMLGKDPTRLLELPDLSDPDKAEGNILAALRKLGAPETADAVELPELEGLPAGFEIDKGMQSWFKETGAQLGLLPNQMAGLYKNFMARVVQGVTTEQETARQGAEQAAEALKKELGAAYEPRLAAFKSVAAQLGENFVAGVNKAGLALDPQFVTTIAKLGPMLQGDKGFSTEGAGAGGGAGVTPAEATAKADALTRQSISLMHSDPIKSKELMDQAVSWRERAHNGGV